MRLSHCQVMRKLSVQPEESGMDDEDEYGGSSSPNVSHFSPLSMHASGPNNNENDIDNNNPIDANDAVRKLSILSMSSSKSSSSLSSICSAPGGIVISCSNKGSHYHQPLKKCESYGLQPMSKKVMTSRPSFISLCSIVSETSEAPAIPETRRFLPAPLQVEFDLMQRSGMEGDEPKCRSHLPILRCQSDYDIDFLDTNDIPHKGGIIQGIKHFPARMRKLSTEKNRFNVYSISDETREQLKHLYVY